METLNQTPFVFAPIVGQLGYPKHSLTLVVKATFDLKPEGVATPLEEQPFPSGDEPYPDDEEQTGGPRYESDFAHFKPRTDLMLVGKCHAPGGAPTETCAVTFRVGGKSRTLTVIGDRYWDKGLIRSTVTKAKPFTEMELRYEHAFGGKGFKQNPAGKGYAKVINESDETLWPLPNIEDPQSLIQSPRDQPQPAGFGPLGKMWQDRHAKLGTYKGTWSKTRFPWFPEDLDWTHFNAAPDAMQAESYLRGDEEIYLENLHPEHTQYRCRLPGLRVRCFLDEVHGGQNGSQPDASSTQNDAHQRFHEVVMNLDTLWVDAEAEQLVLLWRGNAPILSEDYEELAHLFVMSELLSEPSASIDQCRVKFQQAKYEEEAKWNPPPEEEPPQAAPATKPPDASDAPASPKKPAGEDDALGALPPEVEDAAINSEEKFRQACQKAGIDPDNPPPLTPEAKKLQARFLKIVGFTDDDMLKGGIDPGDIPSDTPEEKQEQAKLRKQMGLPESDEPEPEPKAAEGEEAQEPPLTRERVQERAARSESFAGEDLSGLDLSKLDLCGIDFSQAIFTDASLAQAKLDGANLADANLAGVDMTRTSLKGATLDKADLANARLDSAGLSGASLGGAVFEKAIMTQAVLDQAAAAGAVLSGADLSDASFKGCDLEGADLAKSKLAGACFEDANLKDASVEGASGVGVVMDRADLTCLRASEGADFASGSFRQTTGQESMWVGANLQGADFSYAAMEGADFTKACLRDAKLYAANMKFSRFTKADLRGARLTEMNLFESILEKANLDGADISGSNLYGAEFLEAQVSGMITENTNLKMTKLAGR